MAVVSQQTTTAITFAAPVSAIDSSTIVRLPDHASAELPSRGQVAVVGTINDVPFSTVVEPDGMRGHWIRLDHALLTAAGIAAGDEASVAVEVTKDWPEPNAPADLQKALDSAPPHIQEMWDDITPMARWEWVRWVNATANAGTRQRRVEVTISKMDNGKRRPCCFDLSACTDPSVAKNGKLRDA